MEHNPSFSSAVRRLAGSIRELINRQGGCDHDASRCWCEELRDVAIVEAYLNTHRPSSGAVRGTFNHARQVAADRGLTLKHVDGAGYLLKPSTRGYSLGGNHEVLYGYETMLRAGMSLKDSRAAAIQTLLADFDDPDALALTQCDEECDVCLEGVAR